jgi:hypothetical protein
MKFSFLTILMTGLLIGCQSLGYSFIEMRDIGSKYQEHVIRWSSGSIMRIRLQPNNVNGILGICGYYISDGGIQSAIEEVYLQEAFLEILGQRITEDIAFLTQLLDNKSNRYSASCVKTKIPYKAEYHNTRMRIVGPKSVTISL